MGGLKRLDEMERSCLHFLERSYTSLISCSDESKIVQSLPAVTCVNLKSSFFVLLRFYEYLPNHSKIRIFAKTYQGDLQNSRVREIRLSSVRPSLSDHLCRRPSLPEGDVRRTSTHFIRNCAGFCRITPLRWVSACQRTGLTGLSTAANGGSFC